MLRHDIGSGGLMTTLLEMCFAENKIGLNIDLSSFDQQQYTLKTPAVVIQINAESAQRLKNKGVTIFEIGEVNESDVIKIQLGSNRFDFHIPTYQKTLDDNLLFDGQSSNSSCKSKRTI